MTRTRQIRLRLMGPDPQPLTPEVRLLSLSVNSWGTLTPESRLSWESNLRDLMERQPEVQRQRVLRILRESENNSVQSLPSFKAKKRQSKRKRIEM